MVARSGEGGVWECGRHLARVRYDLLLRSDGQPAEGEIAVLPRGRAPRSLGHYLDVELHLEDGTVWPACIQYGGPFVFWVQGGSTEPALTDAA